MTRNNPTGTKALPDEIRRQFGTAGNRALSARPAGIPAPITTCPTDSWTCWTELDRVEAEGRRQTPQ